LRTIFTVTSFAHDCLILRLTRWKSPRKAATHRQQALPGIDPKLNITLTVSWAKSTK